MNQRVSMMPLPRSSCVTRRSAVLRVAEARNHARSCCAARAAYF
jgi:hypothetical protein